MDVHLGSATFWLSDHGWLFQLSQPLHNGYIGKTRLPRLEEPLGLYQLRARCAVRAILRSGKFFPSRA